MRTGSHSPSEKNRCLREDVNCFLCPAAEGHPILILSRLFLIPFTFYFPPPPLYNSVQSDAVFIP
jgi:hypothetical protein